MIRADLFLAILYVKQNAPFKTSNTQRLRDYTATLADS